MQSFKQYTFLYLLALFSIASVSLFFLGKSDLKAQKEYQDLVRSSKAGVEKSNSSKITTQQQTQVRRDIFFTKKNELEKNRLQICLNGDSAEVVMVATGKKFEVLERSHNVLGTIQEEVFFSNEEDRIPMQRILQFEADDATYSYENQLFIAYNVKLSRYSARNHKLENAEDKKLEMSGRAASLKFSLINKTNEIILEQLQATFYPKNAVKEAYKEFQ